MPRRRTGFSLVELLVALVVFDVALLAFAADAALLVRWRGAAGRRQAGIAAAQSRLAILRAEGCPPPATGVSAPAPGVREYWQVRAVAGPGRRVRDSIAYLDADAPRAFVLHTTLAC